MKVFRSLFCFLFASLLMLPFIGIFYAEADNEPPVRMVITYDPETRLQSDGIVSELIFSIINDGEQSYTLYGAHLLGGYDGEDRILNDTITIDSHSSKQFSLHDIPVSEEQLNKDIIYTLTWYEHVEIPPETFEPDPNNEVDEEPVDSENSESNQILPEEVPTEPSYIEVEKSIDATVRIDKFIPPVLSISASVSADAVQYGSTFTITYIIQNNTKYDMSALRLTDLGVSSEQIELPDTNLMAGETMTINKECVMGEEDVLIHPVITYVAAQRQTETEFEETLTVASVIIGIKLEVEQYPSNEEGTTFAITITNTGNRAMTKVQLYDEINTRIDSPFDLGPQQQKVITFQVPSAYASGLIRTVQFHLTCKDPFNNTFSFKDVNTYECIPFISSDSVRINLLAELTKAFYNETNHLCGTIQFEIRNYSDVRVINASIQELSVIGKVTDFTELQRGETFYTVTYELDNVENLSFQLTAYDTSGKAYETEIVNLDLSQMESLASNKEVKPVIYHSNAFLKSLIDRFTFSFKNIVSVALIIILIGGIVVFILWLIEHKIRSALPRESMMKLEVPEPEDNSNINPSMDEVLSSSPAEQLGYRAPAKMRYGDKKRFKSEKASNAIKPSDNGHKNLDSFNNGLNLSDFLHNNQMDDEDDEGNDIVSNDISIDDIHPDYYDADNNHKEFENTDNKDENPLLIPEIEDENSDDDIEVITDKYPESDEIYSEKIEIDHVAIDSEHDTSSDESFEPQINIANEPEQSGPKIIEFRRVAANRKLQPNMVIHFENNGSEGK